MDLNTVSPYDDELRVKFFETLEEARSDRMIDGLVLYARDMEKASPQ